jgi:hypothetical protein
VEGSESENENKNEDGDDDVFSRGKSKKLEFEVINGADSEDDVHFLEKRTKQLTKLVTRSSKSSGKENDQNLIEHHSDLSSDNGELNPFTVVENPILKLSGKNLTSLDFLTKFMASFP